MNVRMRWPCVTLAMALMYSALTCADGAQSATSSAVQKGRMGFVVSDIHFALAPDAKDSGACPQGMSKSMPEIFAATPEGKRKQGESEGDYERRLQAGGARLNALDNGSSLCMNPELGAPEPNYKVVERSDIPVRGINLDGDVSDNDFQGFDGVKGVDNQFYRVVGCSRSYQSDGSSIGFAVEMFTGAWGILITLDGVDDLKNDDQVTVGIYANADPIYLSPKREPLPYATYAKHQEAKYRATVNGSIKDGKLVTDDVDVRFFGVTNSMHTDRLLRSARLEATLADDGTLSGVLAGYTPIEVLYDELVGYRNATTSSGELAPLPLRMHTAAGKAMVLGYSCHGAYQAFNRYADGHPDANGKFTSISMQYDIKAIPAFVVDVATKSKNADLIGKGKPE